MNYLKENKETKELITILKWYAKKVQTDKKFGMQLLIDVGVLTKKGNRRKPYKHLCIGPDPA